MFRFIRTNKYNREITKICYQIISQLSLFKIYKQNENLYKNKKALITSLYNIRSCTKENFIRNMLTKLVELNLK